MLIFIIFLKIALSKIENCQQIKSINGENLIFDSRSNSHLIEINQREDDNNLNQFIESKQLIHIIEKQPLNINAGLIMDFKIFIDQEKQIQRWSILISNNSCIQILQNQEFYDDFTENNILKQSNVKMLTTKQIGNSSQCNQLDEYEKYNYYIYCFYENQLNIYTINQQEQVDLYFEYNFTDYFYDSKKFTIYLKNRQHIFVIIYNQEKCETFRIDNKKQIQQILKINKNTHKFEEIKRIHYFQEQFLQIYFDSDSIMFNLLTYQFQENKIVFFNKNDELDANFTIIISPNQKEDYLIDKEKRKIELNSKSEIPQIFIFFSKLILLYSHHIEIIDGAIIRQTIQVSIRVFYFLFSNYFIGLDNFNRIILVRFNYVTNNYRAYFVNKNPLILGKYNIQLFFSYFYVGCYEVNFISYEQQENERRQKKRQFLEQTHYLQFISLNNEFLLNKLKISQEFSFYFQLCNNKKYQIQYQMKDQINSQIHNYINLKQYFYQLGSNLIIQCQQNKIITIFHSYTNQVERFRLSCDSSFQSIVKLKEKNKFCVMSQDHYGIYYFRIKFSDNIVKKIDYQGQLNLTNYITKISFAGQYLIAYHQNCTISLFDQFMKFLGTQSIFISNETNQCQILHILDTKYQKQLIFYELNTFVITNYQKSLLIQKQIKNIYCLTLSNDKITYICVHKFLNIMYTYQLQFNDLIQISEFQLFNFQIKRPIDYQRVQNIITIVCTLSEQLYLLIFTLQVNLMLDLSRIIKIYNNNYFLDDQVITLVTNENELEYLPLQYYYFKLDREHIAQSNKQVFYLLIEFVENQTQILSNLTLELDIYQNLHYPQLIQDQTKSLVSKFGEQTVLNVTDFITGPIDNITLLNQQYVQLIPPHFEQLNYNYDCQQRINDICLYNDNNQFLQIYNEFKNLSYNSSLQIKTCNIVIAYFNIMNNLVIVAQTQEDGFFEIYSGNNNKVLLYLGGSIQDYQIMDYLFYIQTNVRQVIIRYKKDELIIEDQQYYDIQIVEIIQKEEISYIQLKKINTVLFEINSIIIRKKDQEIITAFSLEFNNYSIKGLDDVNLDPLSIIILEGSYDSINSIFRIKFIFFSLIESIICELLFSQQNIINLEKVAIIFYPKDEKFVSVFYSDKNYLIANFLNSYWLYQISNNQLDNYYPVFQFESSIKNLNQLISQSCQSVQTNMLYQNFFTFIGEYKLQVNKENINQTLEFIVSYKESNLKFSIVLQIDYQIESSNSNIQFNLIYVILVCLLLIICFLLNKTNRTKKSKQITFELTLNSGQANSIMNEI